MSRIIQILVIVTFFSTLALSLLVPIFTDEITWKFLQARFFLDGFVNITLFPQCGEPFTTPTPWFMLPVRAIDAWIYADISTPFTLRIFGIITAIVWIGILLLMLPKSLAVHCDRLALSGIIFAYLGLGVLPFMMVVNRPEQIILIFLTILFLAPLAFSESWVKKFAWIMAPGLLSSVIILFSYHPKTLLFVPLIAVSAYFLFRRLVILVPIYLAITYLFVQSYFYWVERNRCPGDLVFESQSQEYLMSLSQVASAPLVALGKAFENILRHRTIFYIGILKDYTKNTHWQWLPAWQPFDNEIDLLAYYVVNILIYTFVAVFVIMVFILGLYTFKDLVSGIRNSSTVVKDFRRMVVTGSSLLSMFALFAVQGSSNFYEGILDIPLLGMTILVALTPDLYLNFARIWQRFTLFLMCSALFSQAVLWRSVLPEFRRNLAESSGYIVSQPKSISAFNYGDIRTKVLETAQLCQINISERPRHLVVDDLTYVALSQAYQPFNLDYLTHAGLEKISGDRILLLLTEKRSAGLVAGCHLLPPELRNRATENGPFCCIPAFGPSSASAK